jgi:hypothetical protein
VTFFDSLFKNDVTDWIKTLCALFLNHSEHHRYEAVLRNSIDSVAIITEYSTLHFENILFVLQHLLRTPEALKFSHLIQLPVLVDSATTDTSLLLMRQLSMDTFRSDQLINLYFDFYLRALAAFSHPIKHRREFLFFNDKFLKDTKNNLSSSHNNTKEDEDQYGELNLDSMVGTASSVAQQQQQQAGGNSSNAHWEFVNLEGDLESIESVMIEISEDDLIKLYYQMPLNKLYAFLWAYLEFQEGGSGSKSYPQQFSSKSKHVFQISLKN